MANWKDTLFKNNTYLHENLDLDKVLDKFVSHDRSLWLGVQNRLKNAAAFPDNRDRVHEFLNYLCKRPEGDYQLFLQFLTDTKQEHIREVLTGVSAPEQKETMATTSPDSKASETPVPENPTIPDDWAEQINNEIKYLRKKLNPKIVIHEMLSRKDRKYFKNDNLLELKDELEAKDKAGATTGAKVELFLNFLTSQEKPFFADFLEAAESSGQPHIRERLLGLPMS